MAADYPVTVEIPVRFRDCDPMGHVNNAVYLTYLEVGRQAYWERFSDARRFDQVPFIVARVEIDYRSPLAVGEKVLVALRTSWIGHRSFGTEYELRESSSGRLVAEGKSVQVTFDYRVGAPFPIPDDLRRQLERVEGRKVPDRTGLPG